MPRRAITDLRGFRPSAAAFALALLAGLAGAGMSRAGSAPEAAASSARVEHVRAEARAKREASVIVNAESLRVRQQRAREVRRILRATAGTTAMALQAALGELNTRIVRLEAELGATAPAREVGRTPETPATPATPPTPVTPANPEVAAPPAEPAPAPTPPRRLRAPRAVAPPAYPGWEARERTTRVVRVLRGGRGVTDTTLAATPGMSLEIATFMGDIRIEGWARDVIHVRAEHAAPSRVMALTEGRKLKLAAESAMGPAEVDWNVRVPAWMPIHLECVTGDIHVTGTRAPIVAQSVRGDVRVVGGGGDLDLNSVEGEVVVAGARGNVRAGSINNVLRVLQVVGPVEAQSVNGDIDLSELDSRHVRASSLNGSVWWAGDFQPEGEYRLASHNGTLYVGMPSGAGVDLTVSAYNGEFRTALPMPSPRQQRGRRFEFQMGGGGATVDLESFNGLIRLLRPAEFARLRDVTESLPAPTAPKGKEHSK